jgi:PAS domain S-box-containing protein
MGKQRGGSGFFLKRPGKAPWPLLSIFLLLTAAIVVSGYAYYQKEKKNSIHREIEELQLIADLKTDQIHDWKEQKLNDGYLIYFNQIMVDKMLSFLLRPTAEDQQSISAWLSNRRKHFHYLDIILADEDGCVRLSSMPGRSHVDAEISKRMDEARRRREVLMTDLYRSEYDSRIHMATVIPLFAGNGNRAAEADGFLIMVTDPAGFLFPIVQSWPTHSASAEILLVRREGDKVLFLNELRHRRGTAMRLRFPLHTLNLPAAQAVLDKAHASSGTDYRGIAVWSVSRPIPDTPWFIVAKIDRDEIERPVRRSAQTIFLIVLLMILTASLAIFFLWQRQNARFRVRQLEAESQKQALVQHFDYLSRYANDIILLTDEHGNIVEANERALLSYGYGRETLAKMNLRDLHMPAERDKLAAEYNQVEGHLGLIFESIHQKKDGAMFPVEVSARAIDIKGKTYFQSIVRDISERKQREAEIQSTNAFLKEIIEMSPFAMWISDRGGTIIKANRSLYESIHLAEKEIVGKYNVLADSNLEAQGVMPDVKAVFEKGTPARFAIPWLAADAGSPEFKGGRDMFIDVSMFPIFNAQHELTNVVCQWLDISERKRTEEELRGSEERFRSTLDNMMEGCQIIGQDWRYLFVNKVVASQGRQTKEDLLGHTMMEVYPDIERTEMFAVLRRCMEERQAQQMENEFIYPDGTREWFELSIQPVPEGIFILSIDITERKRAEEALRESEKKFRSLFATMPLGVVYQAADGRIVSANPAAERILGLPPDQMQGRRSVDPRWKSIHEDGSPFPGEEHPAMVALRSGRPEIGVIMGVFNPEEERTHWISISAMPQFHPGQSAPFQVFSIFEDITERKQAGLELKNLSARNEALLDAVPDIIMEVDNDKVYRWANRAGQDFFGANVIGKEAAEYFLGEQKTYQAVQPLFNGKEGIIYLESWQRRRDGEKRLLAWWCRTLKDEAGSVTGALSSARDITEVKLAEDEIRRLNEELEERVRQRTAELSDLYNNAPCGYHSLDAGGVVRMMNDTELGWLGYSRDEVFGKRNIADLLTPESGEFFRLTFPQFKERGTLNNLELTMRRKDGSTLPVLVSATAISDADGHFVMSRSTLIDYSEQISTREAIRNFQDKLVAANKELEAFSYSVSHDLRAPLRAIDGFTRIVLEEYAPRLDGEGRRLLDVIRSNTSKMGHLIDDLLAFSRLSRQQMAATPVNLAVMAKVICAELKKQEKGRRIEFKIGVLPPASGDHAMLQQVLQNLLANAVKFTRPRAKTRIEFSGRMEKGESIYQIKDNGVGFDMQYADKLFGVFQRLHGSDEFEGTGVGLAIVQRIVLRHGGRVWAESKGGKGASFYFAIPNSEGTGDRVQGTGRREQALKEKKDK